MIWTSVALLGVWMSLKAPQPAQAPYQFEFDRIAAQGGVSRAGDYEIIDVAELGDVEETLQNGGDYSIRSLMDFEESSNSDLPGSGFIAY